MNHTETEQMPHNLETTDSGRSTASNMQLWFGALGGAVMWLLHLVMAYLISEFGCVSHWGDQIWFGLTLVAWSGLGISILLLLGTIVSHNVALRSRNRFGKTTDSSANDFEDGAALLAQSGVMANRIFMLIILVQTVPFLFYLQSC